MTDSGLKAFSRENIEMLSESDFRRLLEEKMRMRIDAGRKLAWMIAPFAAEVLVYGTGVATETGAACLGGG